VDSTTKPKNKPQIASRKRKADSSPEVEITEFSKEDKIQNVTLSSSSDDEQEQESEPDNDDEVNPHFLQRHSNEKCSPVQGIKLAIKYRSLINYSMSISLMNWS